MGGFMSYLTTVKQSQASAASSGSMFLNFVVAAVLISAAPPLQRALGAGGLFGLFACLHAALAGNALLYTRRAAAAAAEGVAVGNPAAKSAGGAGEEALP